MINADAKNLWIANFKAFDKYNRNVAKAQFADAQRNGAQFSDFSEMLGRLHLKATEARAAAMAASTDAEIIASAAAEWNRAA